MNYNIYDYSEKVVKRSLNYYDDKNHNNQHMIMGLTSELTDELITALEKNDITNIIEELGDATFFNVGSLIHQGYWETFKDKIEQTDKLLLDLGFEWTDEKYSNKLTPQERKDIFNTVLFITFKTIGQLNTIYKNILVKDTPKYDGEILTDEQICNIHCHLLVCINTITSMVGSNYHTVREVNDKKLFARHKGGTFTPETSLNRNTEEERKLMDETLDKK